jgi:hypothetical protein
MNSGAIIYGHHWCSVSGAIRKEWKKGHVLCSHRVEETL